MKTILTVIGILMISVFLVSMLCIKITTLETELKTTTKIYEKEIKRWREEAILIYVKEMEKAKNEGQE